ncbi:MAG: hypothetical protein ACJ74U_09045 [Jatrophihabitantaceae bacterium]
MTDQRGSWQVRSWAPQAVSAGRQAAAQPLPWLVAAMVFFANAVLTAADGIWWLAALEFATCLLAVCSAISVARPTD